MYNEDGTPHYCESDGFIPGDKLVTCSIDGFNVGLATCYDLRFPEFFAKLAKKAPLDVICVPSAFTQATGEAHWEALLRARSIEWQAYTYAANQLAIMGPTKIAGGNLL